MTTIENILQKSLTGKKIQIYRTRVKYDGDRKRKIPVTYKYLFLLTPLSISGQVVEVTPTKGDILNVRIVGENDYDSQEMVVITVRPLRSKEMIEIDITSMTQKFEIVK